MAVAAARAARVVGAATIIDRHGALDLGVALHALAHVPMPTYTAEDCPLCAKGLPVTKPGSRA